MTNHHLKWQPPIRARGPKRPNRLIGPVALLLVLFGLLVWGGASCVGRTPAAPMSKAEEYPAPWQTVSPAIYRAIYAEGHQCVEGYMRVAAKADFEYLVFCHEPTEVWTTYLVWLPSGRVLGPDRAFAYTKGVPLPERHPDAVAMSEGR
mgnify:FL=1